WEPVIANPTFDLNLNSRGSHDACVLRDLLLLFDSYFAPLRLSRRLNSRAIASGAGGSPPDSTNRAARVPGYISPRAVVNVAAVVAEIAAPATVPGPRNQLQQVGGYRAPGERRPCCSDCRRDERAEETHRQLQAERRRNACQHYDLDRHQDECVGKRNR